MELKSRIVRGLPMLAVVASLLVPMKAAAPAMAQVAKAPGCSLCGPAAVTVSAPKYALDGLASDQQLAFREKRRSPRPRMDGQVALATAALEKPRQRPKHRFMDGQVASTSVEQLAFREKRRSPRPRMDGQVASATAALEKPRQKRRPRLMEGQLAPAVG